MKDNNYCILIADDEKEIRDILSLLLKGEGYQVLQAENGRQAAEMADDEVDLCILDVNMPAMTGFMAAAEIRNRFEDMPLMFLTAYSGESDKVMGFSVGADDYLVKPFSNMELLMRVKAILRRSGRQRQQAKAPAAESATQQKPNLLVIQDIYLDLESQAVLRGEETINLTYTEFKILELLATHRKKIYSLENMYQSIWNEEPIGDGAIMVHIKNIRKKLGDNSRSPKYIKTAWGKGYYVD